MEIESASSSNKKPRMDQEPTKVIVIDTTLTDFKNIAVKFPNMLVDKTQLIHTFLREGAKCELITAPPRFGKSVNLTMFRCFFEIEVDPETGRLKTQRDPNTEAVTDTENYRLFKELDLAIMKHPELVKNHLGRHPVLYVSFKCNRPIKNVDDAIAFCRTVAHISFLQHKYLCVSEKLTDSRDREFCKNWCSGNTFEKMDPFNALEHLAMYLYQHFKRDVVLLVDEYDSLVARALVEVDGSSVEDVCRRHKIDPDDADYLLKRYNRWLEQINMEHNITPSITKTLIKASQQTREEICSVNGIDVNVAQQLADQYKQQMTESWSISNLSSLNAGHLIAAHESNIITICKNPVEMMAPLLKTDSQNIHLLKALVTGVSYIAGIGWSGIVNNITPRRFTQHHPFNRFYGFQLEEIENLVDKHIKLSAFKVKKEDALDIIKAQYNGYEYPGSKGRQCEKIHCPWSVLGYLKEGEPLSFWAGAAYTEPLTHMFENSYIKMFLDKILNNDNSAIPLPTVDKLRAQDLIELKKHLKGITTVENTYLFLNFILELGYLTVDSAQAQTKEDSMVKIPNQEVKIMILKHLRQYYNSKCSDEFKTNAIMKCDYLLNSINLAAHPDVSDADFETALRVFRQELQTLFRQYSVCLGNINESGLHCFMAQILITGNLRYFTEHYILCTDLSKGRFDLLGFKKGFAILTELSYLPTSGKSAEDNLGQILNKEYFKAFQHPVLLDAKLERHILMGICITEDLKMAISVIRNYKKGTDSSALTINVPLSDE